MSGGSKPVPYGRLFDLPRRTEHPVGGASTRVWCDADNAVSDLRKGGGERSRLAGRRAFICALADRLPDRPVRAGSASAACRGRLPRPMGSAVFAVSLAPDRRDVMRLPQTGGCQCGKVRYAITEEPQSV